jgi:putative CocE/NonD family hydrolase
MDASPRVAVQRERGLRCPLDDGTVLVGDLWRPVSGGPFPVLVQQLPYGRSVASSPVLPHPSWLASHGYLVVVLDVRGRGDSEGTFAPFVHAGSDGATAIEWAARLPGSTGTVGTYGFSYQGLLQIYTAAERPPSLRAIAPMMCGTDPYDGWTHEGGCLRWPFVCFWAAQLAGQERNEPPVDYDLGALPPSSALGDNPPQYFKEWLRHHDGNADYWQTRRPDLAAIDVPALVVGGWFDDFSSATLRLAQQLEAELHVGPWSHMPWGSRCGDLELGADAGPAVITDALVAFFDRILKGEHNFEKRGHVRYYTIGRGWETAAAWPPPTEVRSFRAHSEGNANSRHGDGRLQDEPTDRALTDVIVVEPHYPYPGDDSPFSDEGLAEDRRDVCCYTSAPLTSQMVLTGAPRAQVTTRCDQPTNDVVASLILVEVGSPPRRLCSGTFRLPPSGADSQRSCTVQLRPTSIVIPEGARLRLDVSGARFPMFDRNPHIATTNPTDVTAAESNVATLEILGIELEVPFRQ